MDMICSRIRIALRNGADHKGILDRARSAKIHCGIAGRFQRITQYIGILWE